MTAPTKGLKSLGGDAVTDTMDMSEEVATAYESVKQVDVLDISVSGGEIWQMAESVSRRARSGCSRTTADLL
jgi:ABC-type antimicrobial peptide transport system ATPase subunit